jgi:hypothetical protein
LDCLESGLTLAARSGGHPDDQQESDRHDSQHYERPEMMIIRLAAHRAFFFHATRWYQPESAGGLHRKKKETYRGTISSIYRVDKRWRAGLIPLAAKSCARLATKTSQDVPRIRQTVTETLPSSNASMT